MRVLSQTIPGVRHQQNKMASAWGNHSLIAYGCQSNVIIVDSRTAQMVQTLIHHKATVTQVCWCEDMHQHSMSTPYCLKLCSVDSSGVCVTWDVAMGTVLCEFNIGSKSVVDMKWLHTNDACRDLVALLVSPNTLFIWNAERGTKVAKCTFYETVIQLAFDPFNPSFLVLLSPECLIFVDDFSPTHGSHGPGKKFFMSSHNINSSQVSKPKSRRLLSAESLKTEENVPLVDCLQVSFVNSHRNHLLVLYPKEILILDLSIMQAVGSVFLERNTSPFLQVFTCKQRNILYCLHENGCVSVRSCQYQSLPDSVSPSPSETEQLEVSYIVQAISEPLRISRISTVHELLVCPMSELKVAVLMSDGKLLLWEVEMDVSDGADCRGLIAPLPSTAESQLVSLEEEENGAKSDDSIDGPPLCLSDLISPLWYTPSADANHRKVCIRLLLLGVASGISATPTSIRMCPPLTTKNWPYYTPVVAVGTASGSVLLYKLNTSCLYKDICIHSHRVAGIEWLSLHAIITFVHSPPNQAGLCRNEVALTDIQTGQVTYFRKSKQEESAISFIRVSPQKNYLVIVFVPDKPLEIWDARTLTLLKELPAQNPIFPAVEWSQSHLKTILKKSTDMSTVNYDIALEGADSYKGAVVVPREIITFVDTDGACYHVSVEGNKIKNMTPTPNYLSMSNVTTMAWKGDLMVVGDSDGNVLYQDTKNGQSRTIASAKGSVKKIRFAPGKGNTKILILYNNRVDVRDALEEEVCGQIKWGRGEACVEDADWASSDKPVLLTSDGCVHVSDCNLQISNNVEMSSRELEEPLFCPHVGMAQASLQLKCLLQHQPWSLEYNIENDDFDDSDNVQKNIKHLLAVLPLDMKDHLYNAPFGIPQRCLLTAMLFGDTVEIDFWTVALHCLSREQARMKDPNYAPSYNVPKIINPSEDIICPDASASTAIGAASIKHQSVEDLLGMSNSQTDGQTWEEAKAEMDKSLLKTLAPLDLCYDVIIDAKFYRSLQLDTILLHNSKRHLYEHNQKCSTNLLLLGQTDRAVQMLLETDPSNSNYITDLLKACLAATIRSSGASQSTIKVVATNLIANSRLMEGVQLLCLIDKGLDACRYLQAYGYWETAAWLAKSSLSDRDCADVFIRWADHLVSPAVNQRLKALLVLLSIGHFKRVIETLHNMRYISLAALFSEACLQFGMLQADQPQNLLLETVFGEYARYLHSIGFSRAMRHYCSMAGPTGDKLLDQYITSTSSHKLS
ncbi:WD repeat-containing protein 11-like isoform X2 [Dysidea avara]|uniref:WD repeat-containing protein 11-like isoform X2 n=1 Tax=Dysidea avara TaxID=196820 RepID=UPI00332689DB